MCDDSIFRYLECTGSAIVALARFMEMFPTHRKEEVERFITRGVKYIKDFQMPDGSWYGNWGVCFMYGTFFAVRGLVAAGKTYKNCEAIRRAVRFLLDTQNVEGGWGESYLSCPNKVKNRAVKQICLHGQFLVLFFFCKLEFGMPHRQ